MRAPDHPMTAPNIRQDDADWTTRYRNWTTKGNAGRPRNLRKYEFVAQPGISQEEINKRIKYGRY